jgi:hypothetical protein
MRVVPSEHDPIIVYEVGQEVAIRQGYKNTYGRFFKVMDRQVIVLTDEGQLRRFVRDTGWEVGHKGTKYDCPFLISAESARVKDGEYQRAIAVAKQTLGVKK